MDAIQWRQITAEAFHRKLHEIGRTVERIHAYHAFGGYYQINNESSILILTAIIIKHTIIKPQC